VSFDARVDDYINGLPAWQQAICRDLRALIHTVDLEIEETIKRPVQPYFTLHGNVCAFLAARDHVNLFLYDGAIVDDPDHIITGGHENETARTMAFYVGDAIPYAPLSTMLGAIVSNNRAGGWRKLKVDRRGAN
jgi:hypothetical protein